MPKVIVDGILVDVETKVCFTLFYFNLTFLIKKFLTTTKRIFRRRELLFQFVTSAKLWLACVYALKDSFLSIEVFPASRNCMTFLVDFTLAHSSVTRQVLIRLRTGWEYAQEMKDVEFFASNFPKVDSAILDKLMKALSERTDISYKNENNGKQPINILNKLFLTFFCCIHDKILYRLTRHFTLCVSHHLVFVFFCITKIRW
uniref:Uncharacterized protein n=1 Tax=Heterorhabditis bacteriophora TaxID=37862 RepID=A0A1I7WFH1_HETBA